jgi:hypothetical protein
MKEDLSMASPTTPRTESETPQAPARNQVARVLQFSGGILALFALNQFAFGPLIESAVGGRAAQAVYVAIRVIGLVALAYLLAKNAKRNRFQTLSTVILVGFIDQVFFKGIWVKQDLSLHPEAWVGFEPTTASIFLTLAMGYLFFTPMILILGFFGIESSRFRRDWKLDA